MTHTTPPPRAEFEALCNQFAIEHRLAGRIELAQEIVEFVFEHRALFAAALDNEPPEPERLPDDWRARCDGNED